MIADEDVLRLFAQADPRAGSSTPRARLPDIDTIMQTERAVRDALPETGASVRPHRSHRFGWIIAAAAALAAIVMVSLILAPPDASPVVEPIAPPTTPGTTGTAVETYIEARSGTDAAPVLGLLTRAARVDDMWGFGVEELPGLLRFFQATDWQWIVEGCSMPSTFSPVMLECAYRTENAWTAAGLDNIGTARAGWAKMIFIMSDDQELIARVDNWYDVGDLEGVLEPWFEWLQSNHPGDLEVMYEMVDGLHVPRLTDRALALFRTRTAQFTDEWSR